MIERAYGLGERNPDTLPDGSHNRESIHQNMIGTRRLRSLRKWVNSVNSTGTKY